MTSRRVRRVLLGAAWVVLASFVAVWALRPRPVAPIAAASASIPSDPQYASAVQPIFDRRCVPCHACFDSPCQLNLQSFEGFDRGASKDIVYYPERVTAAPPT